MKNTEQKEIADITQDLKQQISQNTRSRFLAFLFFFLFFFFLPLYNTEAALNSEEVYQLVTWEGFY